MAQSLDLNAGGPAPKIRRLNRLPVIAAIVFVVLFFGVILYGLATRGLYFRGDRGPDGPASSPASTYADAMKRNVPDGIIEDPTPAQVFQPAPPPAPERPAANPFTPAPQPAREGPAVESEEAWRARIEREQREQYLREQHRQRMARIQAHSTAYDSPLGVNLAKLQTATPAGAQQQQQRPGAASPLGNGGAADLYAAALRAGLTGQPIDPNGQTPKESFFNSDLTKLGYLPNSVVPQRSP
ncbi:MAG: conjugal transfer protein TrbI, partial [Xanthobacteraceae bacterium]|nr:conjugal transfer protein TrbI [Xanthobacteraceae bacterium]